MSVRVEQHDTDKCQSFDAGKSSYVTEKDELIAAGEWLSLHSTTYRDASGVSRIWESVARTNHSPRSEAACDGVVVVALLRRLLKVDCFIMACQYRPALQAVTLEFPAGLVSMGETCEQCAVRELQEETGYRGKAVTCSPPLSMEPGITSSMARVVTVEVDGDSVDNLAPMQVLEDGENIRVVLIPVDKFMTVINEYAAQGMVVDSRVYFYGLAYAQLQVRTTATLKEVK